MNNNSNCRIAATERSIVITDKFVDTNNTVHKGIEATNLYLEHASEHEPQKQGRSQEIVGVISNTPKVTEDGVEIYELELNKPLKGSEFLLRDKHNHKEYWSDEDFKVILVDRNNDVVFIKFKDPNTPLHTGINPNIEISFDLRSLIINQGKVLKNHSIEIECPQCVPKAETPTGLQFVKTFEHPNMPKVNAEQKEAVSVMLTEPVSVEVGAPGVGKTVTLSIPAISYMAAGKPIAIITPTHVSLDRSLSAINDICLEVGIDLNRVIRLGAPSKEYAEKYPQTLESPDAQEYLKQEHLDLMLLEVALEYRSMQVQVAQKNEALTVELLFNDLTKDVDTLAHLDKSDGSRANLHKMIDIKIRSIQASVNTPEVTMMVGDLNYRNFYDRFMQFKLYLKGINENENSEPLSKTDRDVLRINKLDHSSYGSRVEVYEELVGRKYDDLSEHEIKEQILGTKIRIKRFQKEYSKKKLQDAYLIGMTVDSYNSRFKEDPLVVHHIFVDEGGYMPLIKAFGLCRRNIPISILGDPMQLPPISEMSNEIKRDGKYEQVLLYDMSAFYLETLFTKGYEGLKEAYFNGLEPTYNTIPKVDLTQTYRFGNKLADILDQYVYKNGFKSAIGEGGFELQYINAVNEITPPGDRVNPAEADAIRSLLASGIDGNVAILTAYKNQVGQLKRQLKGLIDPNQIMTIHKSQGQEWHTVIISVVDHQSRGAYGMWFTSSTNNMSKGLKVVNTAVSRAKKRLIIVGHHGFWMQQQDQLLGELFRNAEKLELN